MSRPATLIALLLALAAPVGSAVVDRLALVVGKTVFTQSEVEDEVRLNELENAKPLDLSAALRKEAAERLIDQQLLRDEIGATGYLTPPIDSNSLLAQFCRGHYPSMAQCRAAFAKYGVAEAAVEGHLAWEVTALRFTDQRFAPIVATTAGQASDDAAVDREMESWLKERRADTRIVYKPEAFQ